MNDLTIVRTLSFMKSLKVLQSLHLFISKPVNFIPGKFNTFVYLYQKNSSKAWEILLPVITSIMKYLVYIISTFTFVNTLYTHDKYEPRRNNVGLQLTKTLWIPRLETTTNFRCCV